MPAPIHVTKAIMPDKEEYFQLLHGVFDSHNLTNNGQYCRQLEDQLMASLGIKHLVLCANGTLALQLALHAAGLAGKKVITTPFSYTATVSALLWIGCDVVFADIDPDTLCLDPASVLERLTPDIAGLLPVHVYGNMCDIDGLEHCAQQGVSGPLPIIYDGAQSYGSLFRGRSALDYGDYTACSFHATKIFHTAEGGCVVARTKADHEALQLLRACGHVGDEHYRFGVNAKLSELHAAMGLCLVNKVAGHIESRKKITAMYDALLPEHGLRRPVLRDGLRYNYAYYPVIFEDEKTLLRVVHSLAQANIHVRRYFYPALNTLPYLKTYYPCPVAEHISRCVCCLPLYDGLEVDTVERIAEVIKQCLTR